MIRVMIFDKCQCDPGKCTAKRMVKFGLGRNVTLSSIPSGTIVLSPFAEQALSPADRMSAETKGIAVMDLTWTNIDDFPKVRGAKERALPYLIASNPVNQGITLDFRRCRDTIYGHVPERCLQYELHECYDCMTAPVSGNRFPGQSD